MAPKTKHKETNSSVKKTKLKATPTFDSGPVPEELARNVVWQNEVQAIVERKPESIEQAVSMLIESVVGKMSIPDSAQEETKEFLELLFDTDPALKDLIRQALKI
jgi:hypothetical protein